MTFGEKIKTARRRLNMNQDTLAERTGVSRRTVTSWETDRALPRTRRTYEKLASVLNVSVGYLLTEDDPSAPETSGTDEKNMQQVIGDLNALFSGGKMAEEDLDELMFAVQQLYVEAKLKRRE